MAPPLTALLDPFWRSPVMVSEPVIFITSGRGPDEGLASARLLFAPDADLTITDTTGRLIYEAGRDYTIDREGRRITRTADSRLPLTGPTALAVDDVRVADARLAIVTYNHRDDRWDGYIPPDGRVVLPRARVRLQKSQPLTLAVIGDSISEGYDASGFRGVDPQQPPYAPLVAEGLQHRHGSPVTLRNFAVAGSTSENGRWVAADAAQHLPDLVIVAFGMNDACYVEAEEFAANITDILARIQQVSPESECLLVTPMRPTAACTWVDAARFSSYREALQGLARPGVAVADVMQMWDALLARKHEQDLSGNGSNHPNDFGHRVYAQTILATLGASRA